MKFLSSRVIFSIVMTLGVYGCGSGSGSSPGPTSPSPAPSPAPPPAGAARITITATAYVPEEVTIPVGSALTFVNGDRVNHVVNGGRDPDHLDCPEINNVGLLTPGQSGVTAPFMTARTCDFHDHLSHELPPAFVGRVVIR